MASQTKNPAMRPENLTEFQCLLRAGLPMVTESRLLSSYPHTKTGLYTRVKLFMQTGEFSLLKIKKAEFIHTMIESHPQIQVNSRNCTDSAAYLTGHIVCLLHHSPR